MGGGGGVYPPLAFAENITVCPIFTGLGEEKHDTLIGVVPPPVPPVLQLLPPHHELLQPPIVGLVPTTTLHCAEDEFPLASCAVTYAVCVPG